MRAHAPVCTLLSATARTYARHACEQRYAHVPRLPHFCFVGFTYVCSQPALKENGQQRKCVPTRIFLRGEAGWILYLRTVTQRTTRVRLRNFPSTTVIALHFLPQSHPPDRTVHQNLREFNLNNGQIACNNTLHPYPWFVAGRKFVRFSSAVGVCEPSLAASGEDGNMSARTTTELRIRPDHPISAPGQREG